MGPWALERAREPVLGHCQAFGNGFDLQTTSKSGLQGCDPLPHAPKVFTWQV